MNLHESIEIRPVINGFVVMIVAEEETTEYVFDSYHKVVRFIKKQLTPISKNDL